MKKNLLKNMTAAIAALFIALLALPQTALAQSNEAYVVENGSTLTFYYDTQKHTRIGYIYDINQKKDASVPIWAGKNIITKVVFDKLFKDYRPTTTASWFYSCKNLETVEGIEYLNTEEVTDMSRMFAGCNALTVLDVSKFNTAKVTNMSCMFGESALTTLDLTSFNTANVTDMSEMFAFCDKLTSLNLLKFNTAKVTNMTSMFWACEALTTIYCNDDWTKGVVTESENMFADCSKLKGAVTYDANKTDVSMANPSSGYFTRKSVAYVVENGSTLTFYYDTEKATRTGTGITIYGIDDKRADDTDIPAWAGSISNKNERTTKAVFDSSFKDYKPTTTGSWFFFYTKLETIEGIENLNTEEVTDMSRMFEYCESLSSLDVSKFNTANVTTMSYMFRGCSSLKSLDVSNFNTAKVTSMWSMFCDCSSLTSLDVSKFNTENVISMRYMFLFCKSLTSLDVSKFHTAKVTDMREMFRGCSSLTSIDVTNFNTEEVTAMTNMFSACSALTTIYCNDNWKSDVVKESRDMFIGCKNLKGAATYDANKTDVSMANPSSGYFTRKSVAYVVEDGSTLTFYYDANKATRTGNVYDISTLNWTGNQKQPNTQIKTVVFDSSFKDYRPTTTASWFDCCTMIATIKGMENLNTEEVTNMSYMFYNCSSLTSLDVSNFNTEKVTAMSGMFSACSALTSLDLSKFNTTNVTTMSSMFYGCSALTSLDLSKFNTANVTTMISMFCGCSSLPSLNLSSFNTANVTNMTSMFHNCKSLTSLNVSNFNTANAFYMTEMFSGCSSLTSLNVSSFNTAKVEYMNFMFCDCSSLTSLDVSNFNTEKVTKMYSMFRDCSALTTIYCNDDWKSDVVQNSENMFADCTNLKGAVSYDATKTDVTMANPTTGYFTKKDPSGIDAVTVDTPAARRGIYTLNGVRLNTTPDNLPAGIYVIDGRKVVKR